MDLELYKLLSLASTAVKPTYIREWECDLGLELFAEQLYHLYQLTYSSSIDCTTQETNYKILTRWYRMSTDLL